MIKSVSIDQLPKVGDKIELPFNELPTVGEVQQVYKKGEELWATVKAARADGKIEMHEVLLIITKGVEFAQSSAVQKVGKFFADIGRAIGRAFGKLFGKK